MAGIVVMSSNAGYVGYLLSGSNFSILILLSVFFVSFLVMVFFGWLQFGRKDSKVYRIEKKITRRMQEFNSEREMD